jgi:carotenoid cleavage dioxygenase
MTAHPKLDPATDELFFFGTGVRPPYLTYHRLNAAGELVRSVAITVPGPTMMHDFAITENHVLWLDLPVVFDLALTRTSGMPYRWSDEYGARIGVLPRDGGDADVTWIDVEPGYAFHVANAHEDASGQIVLDAVRYDPAAFDRVWTDLGGTAAPSQALASGRDSGGHLHRWVLDTIAATVSEQCLDDVPVEYPTVNNERTGHRSRLVYAISAPVLIDAENPPSIVKYDTENGGKDAYLLAAHQVPGEAEFVPAPGGTREDDGWLVSIVTHDSANVAALVVIDAGDVAAGPIATVQLPRRVPIGFHGTWIPDDVENKSNEDPCSYLAPGPAAEQLVPNGVAPGRVHCGIGRPSRRNQLCVGSCGQPSGESSQVSWRPWTVMSSSSSAGIITSQPRSSVE